MAEYSRMAKGYFTSTGAAKVINLPFVPDYVELLNYSVSLSAAASRMLRARWDANMGQGYAVLDVYNGATAYAADAVVANGISTFEAGMALQFGSRQQVVGITKANPAVVTVTGHGYSTGDVVMFQGLFQSATTGMPQICGVPFVITVSDANTFTIPWNTNQSAYTALSGSPSGAYVKKLLYPYLYQPGVSYISAITTGSTTTIDTTTAHNLVVGQEVAFRIPSTWGTTQLNSLPNNTIPGSPQYGYVVSVTDSNTVVVSNNSTGYTAFDSNQAFANASGQSFAQMVAVGDVNTGGVAISAGSVLYPPPVVNGVNTINGPAIEGAFVNNTSQGFVIGAGTASIATSVVLVGASGNVIYWRAFLHDFD